MKEILPAVADRIKAFQSSRTQPAKRLAWIEIAQKIEGETPDNRKTAWLRELNDISGAIAAWNAGEAKAPDRFEFLLLRSRLYEQELQWPLAAADGVAMARLRPDNVQIAFELAAYQMRAGQLDQAITTLDVASKKPGFSPEHGLVRLLFLALSGDVARVREVFLTLTAETALLEAYLSEMEIAQTAKPNPALALGIQLLKEAIARGKTP